MSRPIWRIIERTIEREGRVERERVTEQVTETELAADPATIEPELACEPDLEWRSTLARMLAVLSPGERARFDAARRERMIARQAAAYERGRSDGRSDLGREIAARRAAKRTGEPYQQPPTRERPDFARGDLERPEPAPAPEQQPASIEPSEPSIEPSIEQPASIEPAPMVADKPAPAAPIEPARAPIEPAPRAKPRAYCPPALQGLARLARVSVPGHVRERVIVQLPADDASERAGNSLVYGYGLRSLMALAGASRRYTFHAIAGGAVNPHDPADAVRWALSRRVGEQALGSTRELTTAMMVVSRLSLLARQTRARIALDGIDVAASEIVNAQPANDTSETIESQRANLPPERWDAIASGLDALASVGPADLAELAGLLASGDLANARAWAQERRMQAERV